eukprot:jgi/Botrbrau1/17306/Bobra.0015s0059.1
MVLDINLLRTAKGNDPEVVRESEKKRYANAEGVDRVIELDGIWRDAVYEAETLKREFNALNKEIGNLRKAKQDTTELQNKSKDMKAAIVAAEENAKSAEQERDKALAPLGNLVHESVPVSNDEANNVVVKTHGELRDGATYNHVDLVQLLDIVDLEAGSAVAGGRGFFLRREGVLLNQARSRLPWPMAWKGGWNPS